MKTIKFIGENPASFGAVGLFTPGQETTVEAATAARLIAKGYFTEVIQKPSKSKPEDKGE